MEFTLTSVPHSNSECAYFISINYNIVSLIFTVFLTKAMDPEGSYPASEVRRDIEHLYTSLRKITYCTVHMY